MFSLREESESFLEEAPWCFESVVELSTSADDCFHRILMKDEAWQYWHPEVTNINWTTAQDSTTNIPNGHAGSTRTVLYSDWLSYLLVGGPVTFDEHYVDYKDTETFKEFSVNYKAISRPSWMMFSAFRERFRVEPMEDKNTCKFTRTVAVDPSFASRYVFGCLSYPTMKKMIEEQCPQRMKDAIHEKRLPIVQ